MWISIVNIKGVLKKKTSREPINLVLVDKMQVREVRMSYKAASQRLQKML